MKPAQQDQTSRDRLVSVFLSYSRTDRAQAIPIIQALESAGLNVWWDGLLEGGTSFAKTTEAALETSDAVVVLWSETSVQSHWVRDEATRGRDRGCMVPVSIDGVQPPLGFRQIQYIDLTKWRGKADAAEFAELIRAVRTVAAAPDPKIGIAEMPGPARHPSRRGLLAVGGAAVAAAGGGVFGWKAGWFRGAARTNSVAVLPFKNLSSDVEQDYFSNGLSEELRTMLSSSAQLEVAAQTSSSNSAMEKLDARSIAAKLGVANLLDGSVRRAGPTLRITAQLIDGKTGVERWAQSFDRTMSDVLALQTEIATIVADALAAKLSLDGPNGKARIGGTNDTVAFDAYLRGVALYRLAASERSDRDALAAFDLAVKRDPAYAAAHAAKSRVLTVIANNYAEGGQLAVYYGQAFAAANDAIKSAPDLAEGHSALGFALFNGRLDARAARGPYQKSFEFGFGNADILSSYANFAARTGQFEDARRAIVRAQRLDPLNPIVFRNAGVIEFCARQLDAAVPALRTALSLNPRASGVHVVLGDIHLLQGNTTESLASYQLEPGRLSKLRGLAIAERKAGHLAASDAAMVQLSADFGDNSLYQQAQILSQWGKANEALDRLARGLAAGDSGLVQARNDPMLDPLRSDQRFKALMTKLGFE